MLKLEDAVPGTRIRVIQDTTLANKGEVAVIEEVKVWLVVKFDEDEYTTNFDFNATATDFEVVK